MIPVIETPSKASLLTMFSLVSPRYENEEKPACNVPIIEAALQASRKFSSDFIFAQFIVLKLQACQPLSPVVSSTGHIPISTQGFTISSVESDHTKPGSPNSFTDFIGCAETLINLGYASPETLMASGGSAGGLLMGTVVNLRPDLFRGVLSAVPFVDVVTTMLDETIPLTTGEYDEWGNPNNEDSYNYMKSYSPYDNVTAQAYPAMLITTGLHDSQVQYWEPAKWVARLRKLRTNKNEPLLMYCNMETGHGGASGRFESLKETAMEYAFFLDLMGIKS